MNDPRLAKPQARVRDRSRRVILLIVGIIVLSLGDLLITVTCLTSTGMIEANPIAEFLIRHTGSVAVLVAYKTLTVAVCTGVLFRLRRHAEGEAAAWCAVLILALTSLQWYHYAREMDGSIAFELAREAVPGDAWLVLD